MTSRNTIASQMRRLVAAAMVAAVTLTAGIAPAVVVPETAVAKKKKKSCEGGNAGEFFRHRGREQMTSRNEDGSRDRYVRVCNNGRWGDWVKVETTYPGSSDGSEGGPSI